MNANVIIIGGGPAGIITALTAKSVYPDISVCLIKEIGDGVIPCAIPYMMHTLSDPKQNAMGNIPLEKAGIGIIVGKVVTCDPKAHTVTLESGQVLSYERLVLVLCGLDLPYDEKDKAHYHQDPEDEHKDHTEPSHPPSPHHAKIHAPSEIVASLLSKDVTCKR